MSPSHLPTKNAAWFVLSLEVHGSAELLHISQIYCSCQLHLLKNRLRDCIFEEEYAWGKKAKTNTQAQSRLKWTQFSFFKQQKCCYEQPALKISAFFVLSRWKRVFQRELCRAMGNAWLVLYITSVTCNVTHNWVITLCDKKITPLHGRFCVRIGVRIRIRYESAPILNWTQFNFPGNYHFLLAIGLEDSVGLSVCKIHIFVTRWRLYW
jgi:hypothetical protein